MKTITVKGIGKLVVSPDVTVVKLHIKKVTPTYEMALNASARDASEIKDMLSKIGFDRDEIKTSSFSIRQAQESYRTKDGYTKYRNIGYEYNQELRLSFPNDNQKLGEIIFILSKHSVDAEIHFEFTVSDSESAKDKLLASAVENAIKKANILALSAHIQLGSIVDIDYSWTDIEFVDRSFDELNTFCVCDTAPAMDITPDDISASDSVRVVWEIL